ncbi:phosphoglycerate dehydrogenase [Kineothrix sp. MSJ-39]|uniref:NAD(P)-dependent oxidoreductase n=1 Tax=Kineothrix sp. MSJ-39 TaxID=2841533 RepID=UPI001C108048|nr:NAD(P)-dependent oxidoreductase [Kineothrix sp. MSJ-39]MBU5430126.1 phosphoglycerate dehydrogenase [Kineothrix sp. MSJ-39]
MKKVFLRDEIHYEALKQLEKNVQIINDWDKIEDVDAILVRKIKVPDEVILNSKKLKVIGFHGSGMNGINLDLARQKGVDVFAVPGLNAQSVAELNVALALDIAHMVTWSACDIKQGISMQDGLHRFRGHELSGKVAGIIGMGAVGKRTAQILRDAFQMRVYGYARSFTDEKAEELHIQCAKSMDELLECADFIFLAIPYTTQTRDMISYKELLKMKKTAYLINTARGGIVNEEDLCRALKEGQISGAGFDVFKEEPVRVENPLHRFPNFISTPHIAGNSEEALYRVGMGVVDGILQRLQILS